MALSLFNSPLYGESFGDAELAAMVSDAADLAGMIRFEIALARVEAGLGVIPHEAARAIEEGLSGVEIAPDSLAAATAGAGVVVPGLVAALRERVPEGQGHWLHWGATSQDVVDSAQMLALQSALGLVTARLDHVLVEMQSRAAQYADTVMAARTRGQIATPITFGLRIAQWAQPLIAARAGVPEHLCRVQFGGASGANTAIAPHGPAISAALARDLGLADGAPWHTDRSPILGLADWFCALATGLEKMAADLIVMMRSEIAEARAGVGGGSSTMPQKANPVGAEAIVTLARLARAARAGLAAPHAEERDGASWAVEWALLPQIVLATGAALRHAQGLIDTLVADPDRMRANLEAAPGAMAEAASFALARHMPRAQAQEMVKAALADPAPLPQALSERAGIAIDWEAVLSPDTVTAPCRQVIDAIFARHGAGV